MNSLSPDFSCEAPRALGGAAWQLMILFGYLLFHSRLSRNPKPFGIQDGN
jgi:hypothetical protein